MSERISRSLARTIGDAARSARKSLSLTQADAAERLGLSVEFYARIERGHSLPSVSTLARMAAVLNVSADVLLGVGEDGDAAILASQPETSPELRAIEASLKSARPSTLRFLGLLVSEFERRRRSGGDREEPAGDDRADAGG